MTDHRDVVFSFSTETLADAAARGLNRPPERMLGALSRDPRVERLLAVDATRWLPAAVRRGRTPWPSGLGPERHHLRPTRLARHEPIDLPDVKAGVARREDAVRRRARRLGFTEPAIVSFDPLFAAFGTFDWAGPVTFYARDDWARFSPRRPWWPAYEDAYRALRDNGRAVLAVSQPILDRIDPSGPSAVIVNGIDPDEWRQVEQPPTWLTELDGPVATYVGTVDDRVDLDLVAAATESATVLLVGPCRDEARRAALTGLGARLHVAADRDELAAIVAHSDIGLIPHTRSPLTEAMSPLKLFEYRAAGLPVATVSLPPIETEAADDPAIVLAADSPTGFADAVRRAAEHGRDDETERLAYLDAASWSGRLRPALDIALRAS